MTRTIGQKMSEFGFSSFFLSVNERVRIMLITGITMRHVGAFSFF